MAMRLWMMYGVKIFNSYNITRQSNNCAKLNLILVIQIIMSIPVSQVKKPQSNLQSKRIIKTLLVYQFIAIYTITQKEILFFFKYNCKEKQQPS
jgi:hypothetical protein